MKNFRFLPGLLLLASLSTLTLFSCKKEAQQGTTTIGESQNEVPVKERITCGADFCECTITTDADVTLEICGDLEFSAGACSYGCDPLSHVSITANMVANTPIVICLRKSRGISLRISSTSVPVGVTVQVGGSTPITSTIPTGGTLNFNANSTCDLTSNGCP